MAVGTLTRASVAYNQAGTQIASGLPRYEDSIFTPEYPNDKAIMIEEGTTPLVQNGFFTTDSNADGLADNWSKMYNVATTGAAWTIVDNPGNYGGKKQRVEVISTAYVGTNLGINQPFSEIAGNPISMRIVGKTNKSSIILLFRDETAGSNWNTITKTVTPGVEFDISVSTIVPAGCASVYVYAYIQTTNPGTVGDYIEFYAIHVEDKAYSTSVTDVTRAAETLTIPTAGVLSPTEGTWEQMFLVTDATKTIGMGYNRYVFHIPNASGGIGIGFRHLTASANWQVVTYNGVSYSTANIADSLTPNGWHSLSIKWSVSELKVFIDGALRATISTPYLPASFGGNAYVGSFDAAYYWINTIHDDLCISSIARTDADMAERGASVSPLPIDKYTTAKLSFDSNLTIETWLTTSTGTTIQITPPGGAMIPITAYEKCTTNLSSINHAGSFSLELKEFDSDLIDTFIFGSDVLIVQDRHIFRGWVIQLQKSLDGKVRNISLSGADYTAKSQKIIITESYVGQTVSFIVNNLFASYVTWATRANIETCSEVITIKFADKYLWDVMEQLCKISGFEWYIDENLDVHFFQPETRINTNTITTNAFKKGSANLKPDYSKMVNKLWVKGGKALSENFTQAITVSTDPIPLLYTPRATTEGVIVTIGGVVKTLGIQNLDATGTKDFLLNYSEKLLVPDLCTTGSGTIVYKYEYPIKILLEDPISQTQYGIYEGIFIADTNDRVFARDMGLRYLYKYSQPVYKGSIIPFEGIYHPGEQVYVDIPNLNIDGYLQIKEVSYDSTPAIAKVDRTLQIESPERDLSSIIKTLNTRISKLEDEIYQDESTEISVERYIPEDETTTWGETITEFVTILNSCSDTLFVADTLF